MFVYQDDPVWQIHRFLSKNILLFEEKTPVLALFFVVYIVSFHGIKQNKLKWISLLCVYLFVCCHLTAHAQKRRRKIFDGTNGLSTQSKKGKNTILLLTIMQFPPKIQQLIIENYYILLIFIHMGSVLTKRMQDFRHLFGKRLILMYTQIVDIFIKKHLV